MRNRTAFALGVIVGGTVALASKVDVEVHQVPVGVGMGGADPFATEMMDLLDDLEDRR